jgi:hypothetical protein
VKESRREKEMRNAEAYLKVSINECDQFRMPDGLKLPLNSE